MPTAAETRRITAILREMAADSPHHDALAGLSRAVELSRSYGRRRYFLAHNSGMLSGLTILIDATDREAYIKPAERAESQLPESSPHAAYMRRKHVAWARETLYFDALFTELENAGYTLSPYSETRETLAAYRAAPRPAFLDA